jgi:hypothetical protein
MLVDNRHREAWFRNRALFKDVKQMLSFRVSPCLSKTLFEEYI